MRQLILAGCALLPMTLPARSQSVSPAFGPDWTLCRPAIRVAERGGAIPDHLLAAIGLVESGRRDPSSGRVSPWPWTINAEGQGVFYDTKAAAIAAVRALEGRGVRSIDVGCMQVNLMRHPQAFSSLEQAFDPRANTVYAARFLNQLHDQTNDWAKAAGLYHSATPEIGADYQRRVLAAWPEEKRDAGRSLFAGAANAWGGATVGGVPAGRVAVVLPTNPADSIRIIPLGDSEAGARGRRLELYRTPPVATAMRGRRGHGG